MSIYQTSLADEFASLRTATAAQAAPFWLPDALHAMIIACLVRLFDRLEHLAQLWQSGQLPPPLPTPPARPRQPHTRPPAIRSIHGPRIRDRSRAGFGPSEPDQWEPDQWEFHQRERAPAMPGQPRALRVARSGTPAPSSRPCPQPRRTLRPARAPPPTHRPNPSREPPSGVAHARP